MKLGSDTYDLPPTLNHDACAVLAEALVAGRGQAFTLDAAHVHHLGARAAQLIAVAARSWQADGFDFQVEAPSKGFLASLRKLGLTDVILDKGISNVG